MPRMRPCDRKNQETIIQRRVDASQLSSRLPVMSAASPNANGTVAETKPRYSDGGCVAMYGFCKSGLSPFPECGVSVKKTSNGRFWKMMRNRKKPMTTYKIAATYGIS